MCGLDSGRPPRDHGDHEAFEADSWVRDSGAENPTAQWDSSELGVCEWLTHTTVGVCEWIRTRTNAEFEKNEEVCFQHSRMGQEPTTAPDPSGWTAGKVKEVKIRPTGRLGETVRSFEKNWDDSRRYSKPPAGGKIDGDCKRRSA